MSRLSCIIALIREIVMKEQAHLLQAVFDMIHVRVCNGSGTIKEEPPLDLHQMVVWSGGAKGNQFAFYFSLREVKTIVATSF